MFSLNWQRFLCHKLCSLCWGHIVDISAFFLSVDCFQSCLRVLIFFGENFNLVCGQQDSNPWRYTLRYGHLLWDTERIDSVICIWVNFGKYDCIPHFGFSVHAISWRLAIVKILEGVLNEITICLSLTCTLCISLFQSSFSYLFQLTPILILLLVSLVTAFLASDPSYSLRATK
jgi:hypothetical protein